MMMMKCRSDHYNNVVETIITNVFRMGYICIQYHKDRAHPLIFDANFDSKLMSRVRSEKNGAFV